MSHKFWFCFKRAVRALIVAVSFNLVGLSMSLRFFDLEYATVSLLILKTSSFFVISRLKLSPLALGISQVFSCESRICCRDTSLGWKGQCRNILFLSCLTSLRFQLQLDLSSNLSAALVNTGFSLFGLCPRASSLSYRSLAVDKKNFFWEFLSPVSL